MTCPWLKQTPSNYYKLHYDVSCYYKSSYYRLAKKFPPDKYSEDKGEKFIKIGEAYQILSDPELKQKYDKNGLDGIKNETIIEPSK